MYVGVVHVCAPDVAGLSAAGIAPIAEAWGSGEHSIAGSQSLTQQVGSCSCDRSTTASLYIY